MEEWQYSPELKVHNQGVTVGGIADVWMRDTWRSTWSAQLGFLSRAHCTHWEVLWKGTFFRVTRDQSRPTALTTTQPKHRCVLFLSSVAQ